MIPVLLILLSTASSYTFNLTSLFPPFRSDDASTYMDIELKNSSNLFISFDNFTQLKLYLNNKLVYTLNQSSTVNFTLDPGYNTLLINEYNWTRFIIGYSNSTFYPIKPSLDGVLCQSNSQCNTTMSAVNLQNTQFNTNYILISNFYRHYDIKNLGGTIILDQGVNYIMFQFSGSLIVFRMYRQIAEIYLKELTILTPGVDTYPRFIHDSTWYALSPLLNFNQQSLEFRASTESSSCSISYVSESSSFIPMTVKSGTVVKLYFRDETERLIITTMCSNYKLSYSFSIFYKSRSNLLSSLSIYEGQIEYPFTNYSSINASSLNIIPLKSPFTQASFMNYINDIDYLPSLALKLMPSSEKSSILVNGFDYLPHFVNFEPKPGNNSLNITILAEDPLFKQDYYLDFYMRNNDSTLSNLSSPLLQPSFSPSTRNYRSFIDFPSSSIPIFLSSSDPKSSITLHLNNESISNQSHLQTNLSFDSSSLFISIQVQAETASITSQYNITFIRLDSCGNGLRYSTSEQCDDGNLISNDGCSQLCTIEKDWTCSGGSSTSADICTKDLSPPDTPEPVCGNNKKERGEECDDAKNLQCVACKITPSVCGNGVKERGEECDDGNLVDRDGCSGCKVDSNGDACGDGLKSLWTDEECDDGNNAQGDGCYQCRVEDGWECTNSSVIVDVGHSPDTCWKIESESSGIESSSDSSESSSANATGEDSSLAGGNGEDSEVKWDDFGYVGTASFFIVTVSSATVILSNFLIGSGKLGISLIPGILTPVWMLQVLFCFESASSSMQGFFRFFGWAHLHFYQPIHISSRRLVDLLGTQIETDSVFLENIQYWLFLFFLLLLITGMCWLFLPKATVYPLQAKIFIYFYLFSSIPVCYFSVNSFCKFSVSSTGAIISFVLSILAFVFYFSIFAYFVFCLLCCPSDSSFVTKSLIEGLKTYRNAGLTNRTNDDKDEQNLPKVPERVSLEEQSSGCHDEGFRDYKNLEKTRARIQSAPISVFKYKPAEKIEEDSGDETEFRFFYLVVLGFFEASVLVLAASQEVRYLGCSLALVLLLGLLGIVAYKPVYVCGCYTVCHIVSLFMLVVISGLLISRSEEVYQCSYYFVIFLVFTLLCAYVYQFVWILMVWMNVPENEIKDFAIKPQEPSISYVRDSIPEERAPNSATINNISYDISISYA